MSSKRSAGFQLTRFEHEAERPGQEIEEAQTASQEVLSRRKIAPRPKARGIESGTFGAAAAPAAAAAPSNPFSSFGSASAKPAARAESPADQARGRLIGLNSKFAQTIASNLTTNPAGSWAAACEKYLAYIKTIDSGDASPAPAPAAPAPAPVHEENANMDVQGSVQFNPPSSFTFGKPAKTESTGPVKFEAPKSFTFGGQKPKKEESKPLFGFAQPESKPETKSEAPSFSFGSTPKINFSGSTGSSGSAPLFGANSKTEEKPFSFGAKPEESKPFTFGAKTEEPKPFSFGSSDSTPAPAKFSFGKTEESKPAFTFGKTEESRSESKSESKPESKPAFSFGAPAGDAPKFTFGQPNNSDANVNSTWKPSEKPQETAEDEGDAAPAEPQQDFTGKGVGEESEDSVFEVRTKLYDSKNESAGLGVLRVLVHRETKKSRVVVRADGSGRVLINTIIPEAVNYVATKNFVTVPAFGADKPVPYRARVKTEESAKELADKLNEVKA